MIPGLGRSPGGRNGNPLQFSCLENPNGQSSLAGSSTWGSKESEMTERLTLSLFNVQIVSVLPLPFRFGCLIFFYCLMDLDGNTKAKLNKSGESR